MLCVSTTPLLFHDNAPAHKAQVANTGLKNTGFEELSHPSYSPEAISRSSQCSTTGVTKAMVCAILSVG